MISFEQPQNVVSATVELEQRQSDGRTTVGTGFLVNDPAPDGRPRTVLVTANHVLERMALSQVQVGYRIQGKDGAWRYAPQMIVIRDGERALWRRDADHDVAAIEVTAPAAFAKAAIPLNWLAGETTFAKYGVGQGDEMMVLGYPQGLSANPAGFPILRSGRVASPIEAADANPSFLLDFRVFPGNSGGPVFLVDAAHRVANATEPQTAQIVAGMLTQQVELEDQRLEIGVVTDAQFIRGAIAQIDKAGDAQPARARPAAAAPVRSDVSAVVGHAAWD